MASGIKEFILSLICASSAVTLIEGFVPDGGMKKCFRYLMSLILILGLLLPFRTVLGKLPGFVDNISVAAAASYSDVDSLGRVNNLIGLHIRNALCDRFALGSDEISVDVGDNGCAEVTLRKHFGILGRDVEDYIESKFSVDAEVKFVE